MAAIAQYAVMTFIGLITRKTYSVDIYLSDVANALVRWDQGNGASASSPDYWRPPEPVILKDYAQVTGTSDTHKLQLLLNGQTMGTILRYTVYLTSLNNRPPLSLGLPAGANFQALQLAN